MAYLDLFGKKSVNSKINSPLDYSMLAEKIKKKYSKKFKKINFAILSTYTAETLKDYLIVELAKRSLNCELKFFPLNQFEQEILNKDSKIYDKEIDVILLLFFFEDFGITEKSDNKQMLSRISKLIKSIREKSTAKIFMPNFFGRPENNDGNLYPNNSKKLEENLIIINKLLLNLIKKKNDVFLIDFKKLVFNFGAKNIFDKKLDYIGKVPFSVSGQINVSNQIARYISASFRYPKKCLVLDADNTLWGGIVGELGKDNILLSESYPGNTFKDFHRYILELYKRGIILALASKNNYEDVKSVFSGNDDSLLKLKHFSSIQVNWNEKFINLKKISNDLNIGLDSLVFFDDNPFERELIKKKLPEVSVIDVPKDSSKYIKALEDSELFDTFSISSEDRKRNIIYNQEKKRKVFKSNFNDIDSFLKNLKMKAKFYKIKENDLGRAVQLLSKTNQFNLTTRRHSETDLISILKNGGIGYTMRISDCFGDNGVVGLILISKVQTKWYIDSFLLSCRVIGRKAEDLLLSFTLNNLLKINKKKKIEVVGEYIPTPRNPLVKDFFKIKGFLPKNNLWYKKVSKPLPMPKFFKIVN